MCPHSSSRYPLQQREKNTTDFVAVDPTTSLISKQKKRVSIAQQQKPVPSTSTAPESGLPRSAFNEVDDTDVNKQSYAENITSGNPTIPIITVPDFADFNSEKARLSRDESSIELQNLELAYDLESVSSNDSDSIVIEMETNRPAPSSKLTRTRVPVHTNILANAPDDKETCLSIVVERSDNSECSVDKSERHSGDRSIDSEKLSHSGILLSPLQLEQ